MLYSYFRYYYGINYQIEVNIQLIFIKQGSSETQKKQEMSDQANNNNNNNNIVNVANNDSKNNLINNINNATSFIPRNLLPQKPAISSTLSTKNLFFHYFLLHDFFLRLTKVKPTSAKYFDMQLQVNNSMINATKTGSKIGLYGTFALFATYCFKGNHKGWKVFFGFLYGYWLNHFATLGSYLGALLRMPSVYRKVGDYFLQEQQINQNNYFVNLTKAMAQKTDYQQTQPILNQVFNDYVKSQKTFTQSDFFIKNKEKYFKGNESEQVGFGGQKKLAYFDCFLSRYVYYSFARWWHRFNLALGTRDQSVKSL